MTSVYQTHTPQVQTYVALLFSLFVQRVNGYTWYTKMFFGNVAVFAMSVRPECLAFVAPLNVLRNCVSILGITEGKLVFT